MITVKMDDRRLVLTTAESFREYTSVGRRLDEQQIRAISHGLLFLSLKAAWATHQEDRVARVSKAGVDQWTVVCVDLAERKVGCAAD